MATHPPWVTINAGWYYECTFCVDCADGVLAGICPNCGGNFVPRPIRPPAMLARHPASAQRIVKATGCVPAAA